MVGASSHASAEDDGVTSAQTRVWGHYPTISLAQWELRGGYWIFVDA